MWDDATLGLRLGARLGASVRAALADTPLPATELTPGERARFAALAGTARAASWLRGRAALRRLLGSDSDTADVTFPCARLSLSHSAELALAIRVEGVAGVGVDLETRRLSMAQAERWRSSARIFATVAERQWLERAPEGLEAALLRLWTIKEAVFKADGGNAGRVLGDYAIEDPSRRDGDAVVRCDPQLRVRYASLGEPGAMLAAAVRRGRAW